MFIQHSKALTLKRMGHPYVCIYVYTTRNASATFFEAWVGLGKLFGSSDTLATAARHASAILLFHIRPWSNLASHNGLPNLLAHRKV